MVLSLLLASLGPGVPCANACAPCEDEVRSRASRLERRADELAAELERMRAEPWAARWIPALKELRPESHERWVATSDGYLAAQDVRFEIAWSEPAPGRDLDRCVDAELEGHPLPVIAGLARDLEAHGIDFVVVPVPARLHVSPELVLGRDTVGRSPAAMAPALVRFLAALTERGVEVVDLLPVFAGDVSHDPASMYLRFNRHWSPYGARLAALAVRERLRELASYEPGPLQKVRDFRFRRHFDSWQPFDALRPADTVAETLRFYEVRGPKGRSIDLVSKESPVLLIGDSFVKYFDDRRASFAENLAALVGRPLDVVAQRGGRAVHRALRLRTEHGVPTKSIVIWLFSASSLADSRYWKPVDYFE